MSVPPYSSCFSLSLPYIGKFSVHPPGEGGSSYCCGETAYETYHVEPCVAEVGGGDTYSGDDEGNEDEVDYRDGCFLESLTVIDHRFAASDGSERRAQLTSAR